MSIPTVDLSDFFTENGDHCGRKKAMDTIREACCQYGFFQIINHGIPIHLMNRALQLSRAFFESPIEEKLEYSPKLSAPLPGGYSRQPENSLDKNEYLLLFSPESDFCGLPNNPPRFGETLEEMFTKLQKLGEFMEKTVNDCLGLPPGFLGEYNSDRSWDFMVALRYFPATGGEENNGLSEHQDGNVITFVIQDSVGGLEVLKDREWIPVVPAEGTIVVNLGDVIQVLSNNKFKSATHRVVRWKEMCRHSFAFFYNIEGDKWIEPLPAFTSDVGESPKYRGFAYKDYQALRMRNKTHPPAKPDDAINIKHYAISM